MTKAEFLEKVYARFADYLKIDELLPMMKLAIDGEIINKAYYTSDDQWLTLPCEELEEKMG